MYHSITFGEKNSFNDWHLVATERPTIAQAAPKVRYIDLPGANSSIDLTDALSGRASLSNREGSFEFYVLNDYDGYDWVTVYEVVMNYLHGQKLRMTLEDDPNYYYYGRFAVNQWKSQKDWSRIVIDYNLEPDKHWQGTGTEPTPAQEQGTGMLKPSARRAEGLSMHSVIFGNVSTYDDWHLVAAERPAVSIPKPKTHYVDAPGSNGNIDLTNVLVNEPVFENREGSFEFYVLNEYSGYNWVDLHDRIVRYLHGKKMHMTLEDDPNYYYEGRFSVDEWKPDQNWSHITINYNLTPEKHWQGVGEELALPEILGSGMTRAAERRALGSSIHSIAFGNVNTYDDWHLMAADCPIVEISDVKTHYVDIDGTDGQVDLTYAPVGEPTYTNCEGSFVFYAMNDYQGYDWVQLYNSVVDHLNGQCMHMTLEDDPNYYYEGRFFVNEWKSNKDWSQITIDYNLEPQKYWQGSGEEPEPVEEHGSGMEKALTRYLAGASVHSVVFDDVNTYDDWKLIASERPSVALPKVKTHYIDLPGADGQLDLSDILISRAAYANREGSFEFYTISDTSGFDWVRVQDKIVSHLHGKRMNMYLEDDPYYYYKGMFTVEEWAVEADKLRVVIGYNLDPYKYYHEDEDEYAILDNDSIPILSSELDKIYSSAYRETA